MQAVFVELPAFGRNRRRTWTTLHWARFRMFTVYDKDTLDDLSNDQRKALRDLLRRERDARRQA